MNDVRLRIQKISRILRIACRVGAVVLTVLIIIGIIFTIAVTFSDYFANLTENYVGNNEIFQILRVNHIFSGMNIKYVTAIGGAFQIISFFVLRFYLRFLGRLFEGIEKDGQPFTMENAKKLRHLSYTMPLLMFYNIMMGIIMFFVTLLFAYLFEYGSYLQDKADETSRIQEEMIVSFAEITENKSEQTGQHVRRVAEYSKVIATELGLPDDEIENIKLASTMHDIGKLLIPTEILEKPAKLTDEEYAEIKKHSGYGGDLLKSVEGDVMQLARTIALEHHERVDGRGYPDGKNEDEISLEGKIVAVADVYDALTSKRSYKEPWDEKDAYAEIIKGSGTQFDEKVVDAFINSYDKINDIRVKYADGISA